MSHTTGCQAQVDSSCVICYRLSEIMKKEFRRFWKWYREEVPEVTSYSGKTEESFEELMDENFQAVDRTGTEKARMKKRLIWLRMFKKEFSSGIVGSENYIRSRHDGIFQEGIFN